MKHRYVRSIADVAGYHPANHSLTTNHRLVDAAGVGAKGIEVLHGTLMPGGDASPHAHPGMEQVAYILEGEATVDIEGETAHLVAGDCCYIPADAMHSFKVTGTKPMKVLVIYTPPYGEDPAKVRRAAD